MLAFFLSAKAKKRKTGESGSTSEPPRPEGHEESAKEQVEETPEAPQQKEPPPSGDVENQAGDVNDVPEGNPPSPVREPSPKTAAEKTVASSPRAIAELIITGSAYRTPEPSKTLAKIPSKGESKATEKGKTKLELPNYEELSALDLHEAYLARLSTSRDMEAGMVNMLKRKYEV